MNLDRELKIKADTKLVRRSIGDVLFSGLTGIFTLLTGAILVALATVLAIQAWPSIEKFGVSFFTSSVWDPVKEVFGAMPAVFGTLASSVLALVIAVPISLGTAIFLSELAPKWLRGPGSFVIEMLAAIPSVIIGLWGIFVMVPALRPVQVWLGAHLGSLPFFTGNPYIGFDMLAAALILAIMIIPIITTVSRDAIRAVPVAQKESMLALGATRWETLSRVVLPYCRSSLIGATILGLGRALGETMAVTMVIGNADNISLSLFSSATTIASKIASQFGEASGLGLSSLIELALILLAVSLIVNVIARLLVWKLTSVKAGRV
ncbi:phosphate transport system permease protein [Dehalogenimonas formicexedens]|uniref:Phosphate transport system permease protein n=1 Tax=Dehalogenimonas formicexedens TaxID=1839801 RepID=A0A1P8F909_9CHLR|nr:phosphate ABC transporter permease subunit PstC [Dehalogenimonas formicexedens]APV44938.1 phosphate transport system permease protein [Dehalogenimonas formicexedens]